MCSYMCSCILYDNQYTAKQFLVYYIRLLKLLYFFSLKFIFDKKSIYSEKILAILYQIVKVSVFKKNNVLGSNEYFVVYIDIINLKLKQEIITQQLLTITLLLINTIISIKALWLSLEGHGNDVRYNFFCSFEVFCVSLMHGQNLNDNLTSWSFIKLRSWPCPFDFV